MILNPIYSDLIHVQWSDWNALKSDELSYFKNFWNRFEINVKSENVMKNVTNVTKIDPKVFKLLVKWHTMRISWS